MDVDLSINGKTNVFGIIGDPVEHSFSPIIHNFIAKNLARNFVYVPFHVKNGDTESALKGAYCLGIKGINVTVPHKKSVIPFLAGVDQRALAIGAVNTLKYTDNGYFGYNTDILGILYSLQDKGIYIKNKRVLIIGAGGSACAALVLAASEGASSIIVANRTLDNAIKIKDNVLKYFDANISVCSIQDIYDIDFCDIVIQTTTLGFGENKLLSPVSDKSFFVNKKVSAVFDTIYIPKKTVFLKDAESFGITSINGFGMLIYQALAASEIWLDLNYDSNFKRDIRDSLAKVF